MRALDKKLDDNVVTAIDEEFYLLSVVGQSDTNAGRECLNALNPRAPISKGIISNKVIRVKLSNAVDLAFGPNNVAGLSYMSAFVFIIFSFMDTYPLKDNNKNTQPNLTLLDIEEDWGNAFQIKKGHPNG